MGKRSVVAGSTGMVGLEIIQTLQENEEYDEVIALVRKSSGLSAGKVKELVLNFQDFEAYKAAVQQADVVFCALGTTMKKAGSKPAFYEVDFTFCFNLARAAREMNVPAFVLNSAMGANSQSGFFYNKVKGEIEEAILSLSFLQTFIVRPALLMGNRKEFRLGEKIAMVVFRVINPLLVGSLRKYQGIEAKKVARAMVFMSAGANDRAEVLVLESDALHYF